MKRITWEGPRPVEVVSDAGRMVVASGAVVEVDDALAADLVRRPLWRVVPAPPVEAPAEAPAGDEPGDAPAENVTRPAGRRKGATRARRG